MKALGLKRTSIIVLIAVALLTTACDMGGGSSGGNNDDPVMPSTLSPTTLIGTWSGSWTSPIYDEKDADNDSNSAEVVGTGKYEATIRFNADGTYSSVSNFTEDYADGWIKSDSFNSDADKGTYSMADGILTYTETFDYDGTSSLNINQLPTSGWEPVSKTSSIPVALIDGKMYVDVLTRVGTGAGLTGRWIEEFSNTESSGLVYKKDEYIITSTEITFNHYAKDSSGAYVQNTDKTKKYTYTKKDSTTLTVNDGTRTYEKKFLLSGDRLVIDDSLRGFTKL